MFTQVFNPDIFRQLSAASLTEVELTQFSWEERVGRILKLFNNPVCYHIITISRLSPTNYFGWSMNLTKIKCYYVNDPVKCFRSGIVGIVIFVPFEITLMPTV